jgi:hypothetical protein
MMVKVEEGLGEKEGKKKKKDLENQSSNEYS